MPVQDVGQGSARYNGNKIRMSYIPPGIINDLLVYCNESSLSIPIKGISKLAEHYSLGSAKYPDGPSENGFTYPNWAKGQLFDSMLINSTLRHIYAFLSGEQYDQDFGSHHLIAVAWGLSCLHHQFLNYEAYGKFDDRMWVGFTVQSDDKDILSTINRIQVEPNPSVCRELLTEAMYNTLAMFELCDKTELTFTIDSLRLENIKNKDYGKPITVS